MVVKRFDSRYESVRKHMSGKVVCTVVSMIKVDYITIVLWFLDSEVLDVSLKHLHGPPKCSIHRQVIGLDFTCFIYLVFI